MFLEHQSAEIGFFLDVSRLRDAVTGISDGALCPDFLSAAYLWGVQFSNSEDLAAHGPAFLSLSIGAIAESLASRHPRKIFHAIQAEVLLAYYFIHSDRIFEAKYHTSAAVSLALNSGLGNIRTTARSKDIGAGTSNTLPPFEDPLDEAERIQAFWTVLTLNNILAAADGSPSNISYTNPCARIDTPWPSDSEHYYMASHAAASQIANL